MLLRMIVRSLLFIPITCLMLFLPAGDVRWLEGWAFIVLFNGCSLIFGTWLWRLDPGALAERMRSPTAANQAPRDRAIMAAMTLGFALWIVFMPLDARRFGWSHVPLWAQVLGGGLVVATFIGWALVMRANSFAATTIRLQPERGQVVISSGPYGVVRHPMYAFALLLMVGTPLLLGSLWGLAGLVVFIPLLAARALGEEAMLTDGLPGYRDYAAKVRFRLIPGVW
jgi:protein-S-isoprenylcysteine O-methyltransferase Ste14